MKTILVTGATDGIGRETARALAAQGHRLLVHGRSAEKLDAIAGETGGMPVRADLSDMAEVRTLADAVAAATDRLDVLINNAGVLKLPAPRLPSGLDARFAVNTLAPYLLTRRLLPLMGPGGRVVNLSSAAQAPVDLAALRGERDLSDMEAYAQSKLALTAWTAALARELGPDGPVVVAVNPGSLLGTKMVREGFGTAGNDVGIGADILVRAALSDEFADATGRYYDNDARAFGPPHPDADDVAKADAILGAVDEMTL
jgi:NAD(P)-dependent dehydrogenase (short-subunit alcohol dehydrogenase family)